VCYPEGMTAPVAGSTPPPPLHPQAVPLASLLGTWRGEGRGEYPTIDPFGFSEEVTFTHVGKPFLAYAQKTRALDDGRPLHAEAGYWRPLDGAQAEAGTLELVLAHPGGLLESFEGSWTGAGARLRIELRTVAVTRTATAKEVTETERTFVLAGDELSYTQRMAAVGQPLQHHLAAELRRVP
jgi:hypothetical protein